jgi:hypothetical protein
MAGLKIRAHGTRDVVRRLTVISERSENVIPAWPAVAEVVADEVARGFNTQGASFGEPWRPLAPSTLAGKTGPAPLVETGRLRRLLTGKTLPVMRMTPDSLVVGTVDRIARFQHRGTHRDGRQHIPPRTLIKVTGVMKKRVTSVLADWVMRGDAS